MLSVEQQSVFQDPLVSNSVKYLAIAYSHSIPLLHSLNYMSTRLIMTTIYLAMCIATYTIYREWFTKKMFADFMNLGVFANIFLYYFF